MLFPSSNFPNRPSCLPWNIPHFEKATLDPMAKRVPPPEWSSLSAKWKFKIHFYEYSYVFLYNSSILTWHFTLSHKLEPIPKDKEQPFSKTSQERSSNIIEAPYICDNGQVTERLTHRSSLFSVHPHIAFCLEITFRYICCNCRYKGNNAISVERKALRTLKGMLSKQRTLVPFSACAQLCFCEID